MMQSVLPLNSNRPNIPQPTPEQKRKQLEALEASRRIIREQLMKQGVIPQEEIPAQPVNPLPGLVPPQAVAPPVITNPTNPPVNPPVVDKKKKIRGVLPTR